MPAQDPRSNLNLPPNEQEAPGPLHRKERQYEDDRRDLRVAIDELRDTVYELIQALGQFKDQMALDAWDRQYSGRQSDPQRMRPVTALGQQPMDPDQGR